MPHESLNIRHLAKLPQAIRVIFFHLWKVLPPQIDTCFARSGIYRKTAMD
ncbi:hypothetical protein B0H14DRAFT_3436983 [Mycena olivaceomarginata]|nr:hypothetical protein B0H14DRAFT_3436983 [Mycena olivaceomarginata]